MTEDDTVLRVYRDDGPFWTVELWRPRRDSDPPEPPVVFRHKRDPLPVEGMVRVDVDFVFLRRRAVKVGREMRDAYLAGTSRTERRRPVPEIIP